MPKPSAPLYRTSNWSSYNAALKQRGSLSIQFDRDLDWCAARTGKRGHPEKFSDQAIQACLTLKVLFGLPLRQTVGLVASLMSMAGLDWPVPDWSTLCRRQARISVQIPYRRADGPLNLLIDSTGIRFRGDGEWLARVIIPKISGAKTQSFLVALIEEVLMKKTRLTEPQIMAVLREAESGVAVPAFCRTHGISTASFYKWRAKYGGTDASIMSQIKAMD